MIRSFNDHAANERTLLALVRTGLSATTLGIVVKKGSLLAVVVASTASSLIASPAQACLSSYCGSAFVGMGIAALVGAAVRFVRAAIRIDDPVMHSAGIICLALALLRRRWDFEPIEGVAPNAVPMSADKRSRHLGRPGRLNLRLVGGIDAREIQ